LPYKYPDASVGCGRLQFENIRGVDALVNPVLIVEVLSPSTAEHDREEKFAAYKVIDSFKEYLLISQAEPEVTHYFKTASGKWEREDVTGLEAALKLDSISGLWSLREIYEDVEFGAD
jgi:Uma2 family endonuclease